MALYLDPITNPGARDVVIFAGSVRTPGKAIVGKWERKNEYDIKTGKGTAGATITLKGQPPAQGTITFYAWQPAHFAAWTPILDLLKFDPSKVGTTGTAATNPNGGAAANPGGTFTVTQGGAGSTSGSSSGTIPEPGNTSGKKKDDADTDSASKSKDPPALSAASAIDIFHPFLADIGVHHVLPPEELGSWEEDSEGSALYKREIKFVEFVIASDNSIAATPTGSTDTPPDGTAGSTEASATDTGAGTAGNAGAGAQGSWGAP